MSLSLSSTTSSTWLSPFLAGILATLAVIELRRSFHDSPTRRKDSKADTAATRLRNDDNESRARPKPKAAQTAVAKTTSVLMDSPKLDQRMIRKAEAAIQNRTSRLVIVVERCTNDHNYSAILRTAEALGVQHVYIIAPQCINPTLHANDPRDGPDDAGTDCDAPGKTTLHRSTGQIVRQATQSEVENRAQHHLFAQRALEWIDVREFDTTAECVAALREGGYEIWSTDLGQAAECLTVDGLGLRPLDDDDGDGVPLRDGLDEAAAGTRNHPRKPNRTTLLPPKLAIVFGTEAVGCTTEILSASDRRVYLPLRGFADSLNLSVATALVVHQLFVLDPTLVGSMPDAERVDLRRRWYGKLASQRLETKGEKTTRKRLVGDIRRIENLEHRLLLWRKQQEEAKEEEQKEGTVQAVLPDGLDEEVKKVISPLTKEQMDKVSRLPTLRTQLQTLETELKDKAARAVEGLIENPPEPIGDMRRADEHRATFVGKKTKKRYGNEWANMPATTSYKTNGTPTIGDDGTKVEEGDMGSAAFFRGRLKNADNGNDDLLIAQVI